MPVPTLVTLVLDGISPFGNGQSLVPLPSGYAQFAPNATLVAPAYQGQGWMPPAPVQAQFRTAADPPSVELLPTDDPNVSPSGWQWKARFNGVPGNPSAFSFLLPLTGGATQYLSEIASVTPVIPGQQFVPLPANTPALSDVLEVTSVSPLVVHWQASSGADKNYTKTFTVATSVPVAHNLGKFPAVSVFDSAGDECVGDVDYVDLDNLTLTFSAPFSGTVTCN